MDTDLGTDVDDALALAYALRHPDIELVGISTVFGDVALRTRMVEALLEIAGVREIPVVTGLGKPLTPERPGVMFGHEGRGLLEDAAPISRVDGDPERSGRIDALAGALADASPESAETSFEQARDRFLGSEPLVRLVREHGDVLQILRRGPPKAIQVYGAVCRIATHASFTALPRLRVDPL